MNPLERAIELSKLAKRTKQNYLAAVRSFQAFAGTHWTGARAAEWRDQLARTNAPATVNNRVAALRSVSRRMFELGLGEDFARGVDDVDEVVEKKRRAVGPEVAERILRAAEGREPVDLRDYALLTLGFRTGARRESLQRLDFEDLKKPRITYWIKGGRRHELVADPEVWEALAPWLGWLRHNGVKGGRVFRSLVARLDSPPEPQKQLSLEGINYVVTRRSELAGVHGFHPHLMRHCFVSWLVLNGVSKDRIKSMTGQKSDAMIDLYFTDVGAEADPVGSHLPPLRRK